MINEGQFPAAISHGEGTLTVGGDSIKVFGEKNPADIAWGSAGVDYVVESTGVFLSEEGSAGHIKGARRPGAHGGEHDQHFDDAMGGGLAALQELKAAGRIGGLP